MSDGQQLWGAARVARALGVSPRRVAALAARRRDFPAPAVVTRNDAGAIAVRLWRAEDVERWAATADRSPGRPVARPS